MISVRSGLRILATTSPVDFRRGMDSLAMLVTEALLHVLAYNMKRVMQSLGVGGLMAAMRA
jgi:hypothetical protein